MATYSELKDLMVDSALQNKVEVACLVAAGAIREEPTGTPNHQARLRWAHQTWSAPRETSRKLLPAVLVTNREASVTQIRGIQDSTIQNQVDQMVNFFALQISASP